MLEPLADTDQPSNHNESHDNKDNKPEQMEHRVDFIALLPFDLMSCVLPNLPKHDLIECMHVSTIWHARVSECQEAWNDIQIAYTGRSTGDDALLEAVRLQAHCVRSFDLVTGGALEAGNPWIQLIGDLSNLHTLSIRCAKLQKDELMHGLGFISSTLRRIQISVKALSSDNDVLRPILYTCTHLTHVAFYGSRLLPDDLNNLPKLPDLVHLSLHSATPVSDMRGVLETLLPACPNLQYFCNGIDSSDVRSLELVRKHCPKLQHLAWRVMPWGARGWDASTRIKDPKRTDLHKVKFQLDEASVREGQWVVQFLDQSMDGLENISIHGPQKVTVDGTRHWEGLANLRSSRLHSIDFKRMYLASPILYSIFRQCHALKTVNLEAMLSLDDSIFDALLMLKQLECLHFLSCKGLTPNGLVSFLNSTASSDISLKEIHLDGRLITNDSLSALSNIQSIRKLHLRNNKDAVYGLDIVAKKLVNLVDVSIFSCFACRDSFLTNLSSLPALKRVELLALASVTDKGIIALVDNSPSLRYLAVRVCPMVTKVSISHAQQKCISTRFAGLR
ncbi:hypothetical protein BJV82DRAFT_590296 [Fennellomyces sp. T-0311]|nr:hypothetical protein BJV82DRAFT_590296 [Fennellomyces sp. T-0311]